VPRFFLLTDPFICVCLRGQLLLLLHPDRISVAAHERQEHYRHSQSRRSGAEVYAQRCKPEPTDLQSLLQRGPVIVEFLRGTW
jgi:hypothetical protein